MKASPTSPATPLSSSISSTSGKSPLMSKIALHGCSRERPLGSSTTGLGRRVAPWDSQPDCVPLSELVAFLVEGGWAP